MTSYQIIPKSDIVSSIILVAYFSYMLTLRLLSSLLQCETSENWVLLNLEGKKDRESERT